MSSTKKVLSGCILLPILLFASCAGKMYVDARMYELPGEVLKSPAQPTQSLRTAAQVAETLDSYVQPRFEILRDKNFGAIRIVYPKHAGIVQLKVDSLREKDLIANVNAARREYAICLLHCAPRPPQGGYNDPLRLQVLYFKHLKTGHDANTNEYLTDVAEKNELDCNAIEKKAAEVLPKLMAGQSQRTESAKWEVLMRPVLASKQVCLSCHTEAKQGDTLSVMVYAVRKNVSTASATADRP